MAENNLTNSTTVVSHSNVFNEPTVNVNNTSTFKRKLDKLKTKFFELFFSSNSSCNKSTTIESNNNNKPYTQKQMSTNTLNSSMLISNCYYGYKSSLIETSFDEETKSNNSNKNRRLNKSSLASSSSSLKSPISQCKKTNHATSSISSAFTSTSSIDQSLSSAAATTAVTSELKPKTTNGIININSLFTVINTGYYSNDNANNLIAGDERNNNNKVAVESCNENTSENNPFLNPKYTDLIHFNTNLSLLNTYFESYLDLIDDQDNFFNIDFMINYISYMLLICIKRSSCNTENESKPVMREAKNGENVLKQIARQIFLESENEPCGLKGCQINVYLENLNERSLITQFRIDSTCSLTTFELDLTFICEQEHTGVNSNQSSSITNLTKRLFTAASSNSSSSNSLKSKQPKIQSKHNQLENVIYLDSNSFDLSKRKLY